MAVGLQSGNELGYDSDMATETTAQKSDSGDVHEYPLTGVEEFVAICEKHGLSAGVE